MTKTLYKYRGGSYTIGELAQSASVSRAVLDTRLRRWADVERAMHEPVMDSATAGRRGRSRSPWAR